MENTVSIIKSKPETIDFVLAVEGVDVAGADVRFIVKTGQVDLMFKCQHVVNDNWSVMIPPLGILESTAYPFVIEVVADGYHFNAAQGVLNIVPNPEVYASNVQNTTAPPQNGESVEEVATPRSVPRPKTLKVDKGIKISKIKPTKTTPSKARERTAAQIAEELITTQNDNLKKEPVDEKSNDKIKAIIEATKNSKTENSKTEINIKKSTTSKQPIIKEEIVVEETTVNEKYKKDEAVHNILEDIDKAIDKAKEVKEVKKKSSFIKKRGTVVAKK